MTLKFCGHLFSEYRRNYVNVVYRIMQSPGIVFNPKGTVYVTVTGEPSWD
jgi:hypothetical protein